MSTTEDHKEDSNETYVYEIGYLVLPSVLEENLPKVVSNISSIIKKAGATELDSEAPILEDLAYSMSKTISARKYVVNEAYIGWMKFEAESKQVEGIKLAVDKIEEILRTLLIKVPRETTFTFAEARALRAEREDALNTKEEPAETIDPIEEEVLAVEKGIDVPEAVVE